MMKKTIFSIYIISPTFKYDCIADTTLNNIGKFFSMLFKWENFNFVHNFDFHRFSFQLNMYANEPKCNRFQRTLIEFRKVILVKSYQILHASRSQHSEQKFLYHAQKPKESHEVFLIKREKAFWKNVFDKSFEEIIHTWGTDYLISAN